MKEHILEGLKWYLLSAFALLFALVALILASITLSNSIQFQSNIPEGQSALTSIAEENGFQQGSIENHQIVLSVHALNGLVKAQGNDIQNASNQDVTGTTLDGFVSNLSGDVITTSDTLLEGLEKCTVISSTPLSGLELTSPGDVIATDSVFLALQKLASNIPAQTSYIFFSGKTSSTIIPTPFDAWGTPFFGSLTLPSISLGTSFLLETWGTYGFAGAGNFSFHFIMNGQTATVTITPTTNYNLFIQTFGVVRVADIVFLHRIFAIQGSVANTKAVEQVITLPSDGVLTMNLQGITNLGSALAVLGGYGYYLFR